VVGTALLLVCSGAFAAYQTVAAAAFVRAVPDFRRGQAFGLASTAIRVAQGIGVVLGGAAAQRFAPSFVVAVFGAVGAVAGILVVLAYRRANHRAASVAAGDA
jgi:predicted MFS family arabinose efflux permease